MSGAPKGEYFKVTIDGEDRTYHLGGNVLSEYALDKLVALLKYRHRQARQEAIKDFADYAGSLPEAAQRSFAEAILADSRKDTQLGAEDAFDLLVKGDTEALAILLQCAVREIDTVEEAKQVMNAYGNLDKLFTIVMSVADEAHQAAKN
jgi:hypothetical protein